MNVLLLTGEAPAASYSLDDPTAQRNFGERSTARLQRIFAELGFDPTQRAYLFLDEVQGFPYVDILLKLVFDSFQPAQRIVVELQNAYRFCW